MAEKNDAPEFEEIKTKIRKPKAKTGPQKAPDVDETSRISTHPSANEPGPNEESKGKTEDERGEKRPRVKKGDKDLELHELIVPEGERVARGEERRRVHEEAQFQPGRDTHSATGVDTLKVDGETVQTVTTPSTLDPTELTPSGRDTAIKDQLRADGNSELADAPRYELVGGEWADTDVAQDFTDGPKPTKKKKDRGE